MLPTVKENWLYDTFLDNMYIEKRTTEGHYFISLKSIFIGKKYTKEEYDKCLSIFYKITYKYLEEQEKVDNNYIKNFDKLKFKEYFDKQLKEL